MHTKSVWFGLVASSGVLCGSVAYAQSTAESTQRQIVKDTLFYVPNGAPVMPFGGTVDIIAEEGSVMGATVVGKPYSAESITESMQILGDGNTITRTNRARIYRDAEGRTRREQAVDSLGVWQPGEESAQMVTIDDPVAGASYFMDSNARVARQVRPFNLDVWHAPVASGAGVAMHEWAGRAPHGAPGEPAPGTEPRVAIENFEVALPPGAMISSAPIAVGTIASRDGAAHLAAAEGARRAVVTEDLGEQILEGVLARGTRQTVTIAAGAIGNERPIEIVQEQWYSPELEAIVLRRHSDPRFGETNYRLVNVDRSEPSAELFKVPEDFAVAEPHRREVIRAAAEPGSTTDIREQRIERGQRVFLIQQGQSIAPNANQ